MFWRLTGHWLELTVRFVVQERAVKDAMSRDVMAALDEAHIGIASVTNEIVGVPPLVLVSRPTAGADGAPVRPSG